MMVLSHQILFVEAVVGDSGCSVSLFGNEAWLGQSEIWLPRT